MCNSDSREVKINKILAKNTKRQEIHTVLPHREEDNIKEDLKIGWQNLGRIELARDKRQQENLVKFLFLKRRKNSGNIRFTRQNTSTRKFVKLQ
jgi:hypothetical protein